MFPSLRQITGLTPVLQGFLLLVSCLLTPNVLANPTATTALSSNPTLTDKTEKEQEAKIDNSCAVFTPLTPNQSATETKNPENLDSPTSLCAADLIGVPNPPLQNQENTSFLNKNPLPMPSGEGNEETKMQSAFLKQNTYIAPENSQESLSETIPANLLPEFQTEANPENNTEISPEASPSSSEESQPVDNSNQWHFKFQPYATIPLNTYGTVTARGRTVNYSLGLGQLLQYLRVAGSARIEAWNGNWGFIFDGYFASLKGIENFQKSTTRTPNALNAFNFLLNQGVNTKSQEILDSIDRDIQGLKNVQELRDNQVVQTLENKVQTIKATVAADAQKLRELALKIQDVQDNIVNKEENLDSAILKLQNLPELDLNRREAKAIVLKNLREIQNNQDVQKIEGKIQDLGELKQEFSQVRELLEETSQKVKELRASADSDALKELDAKIDNTKAQLDQKIETIQKAKEVLDDREPQQLDVDSTTDLSFDQGIYDFAVSYHLGDPPSYGLPDKPSNRAFPLIWFEPIGGVRLNSISINIDQTLNFELSSSLVNFKGTFQENFNQGRTWFEPMLGGKFGIQISDPITFWVRGDASGFGIAGETDLSWNVIFGMDWWVRQNISLQLAYRFYEINYKNGSGNDAFGFTESFNGPYISATFNF